jgi:curved DNA-binding protein CbpA
VEDVPELHERALRQAFRQRSRLLHPDAIGAAAADGQGGAAEAAEAEERIRELNRAYETLRKVLC